MLIRFEPRWHTYWNITRKGIRPISIWKADRAIQFCLTRHTIPVGGGLDAKKTI